MMVEVIPFKPEHFWEISPQLNQAHIPANVSDSKLEWLAKQSSFSLVAGEEVLGCFGWVELYKHRAFIWSFISERLEKQKFVVAHKLAKRLVQSLTYSRIEMEVDYHFQQGHRWARMLGFSLEAERLRKAGEYGQDVSLYALIK